LPQRTHSVSQLAAAAVGALALALQTL